MIGHRYICIYMNQMVKRYRKLGIVALLIGGFIAGSCNHYDELKSGDESGGKEESHNGGEDCMRCHHDNSNEASEKWWYVAGTVYDANGDPTKNAEIQLWTDTNGTGQLIYRLTPDKEGNFYTQRIIDFKGGCYPYIKYGSKAIWMPIKLGLNDLTKSCNNCHGNGGGALPASKLLLY